MAPKNPSNDLSIIDYPMNTTGTFGSPSFSAEAFDDAVQLNGVPFCHWKSMACPLGLIDPDDIRRPHSDHGATDIGQCSNGFLYMYAGEVQGVYQGNTRETTLQEPGRIDGSVIQVTFSRFYTDNSNLRVKASFPDRFYLKDEKITVPTWQRVAKSQTDYDSLNYPIVCVEYLIDSNGKSYFQGPDFDIQNGKIHWLTNNRPSFDGVNQMGQVFTCRYEYRPFYYVQKMVHECRQAKAADSYLSDSKVIQMPQSAILVREIYFKTADRDPQAVNPNNPRQHNPAIPYPDAFDSLVNKRQGHDE